MNFFDVNDPLSMKTSIALLAAACSALLVVTASPDNTTIQACNSLKGRFDSRVFSPGDVNYTSENERLFTPVDFSRRSLISLDFWTPTDYLSPACVFTPEDATEVSTAVKILSGLEAKFAVRGGGHMPIPGYANINAGVLIGLTDLNQIQLSEDSSYVSIGPGLRWEEVYGYLEPYGLIALGGRVGSVGVPGLLLGGGISFYSNQYGFASDNVIVYEV